MFCSSMELVCGCVILTEAKYSLAAQFMGLAKARPPNQTANAKRFLLCSLGGGHPIRAGMNTVHILSSRDCRCGLISGVVLDR